MKRVLIDVRYKIISFSLVQLHLTVTEVLCTDDAEDVHTYILDQIFEINIFSK